VVRNLRGDPQKVLEHHNIDPQFFENPDYHIDCLAAVNLLEYCSSKLQDPLFGLRLAEEQEPDVFGCVIALARAAPSLRHALQSLIDFVAVSTSPEGLFEIVTTQNIVELRWRTLTGIDDSEQVHFHALLLIMKTLQMLGREHFHPRYANLTFGVGRAQRATIQDRLGCKVNAKSSSNAIGFSVDNLDSPIATSNTMVYNILKSYLTQLHETPKSSYIEQVETYVRGALLAGDCSVESCAEKLGISTRTLQKHLAQMGDKFSDILQNERIELAKNKLLWSNHSLDEIAFRLGYAEQTSFGRAFKRATGVSPKVFRHSRKH
jgi:AraC-like DNA-binding protein